MITFSPTNQTPSYYASLDYNNEINKENLTQEWIKFYPIQRMGIVSPQLYAFYKVNSGTKEGDYLFAKFRVTQTNLLFSSNESLIYYA